MKFHIWSSGDPTTGDYGSHCVLDYPTLENIPCDRCPNCLSGMRKDCQRPSEIVEFVKEELQKTFQKIFDDRNAKVMTEREFINYTKD